MTSTANPTILDTPDFLSEEEFLRIQEFSPLEGWDKAVVYNKRLQQEVHSPTFRLSEKKSERRKEVIKEIQKIITPRLLAWLRQDPRFLYCWFRYSHTQWIQYRQGMFFHQHQDFEKYQCADLIPYVALFGLLDTEKGGETIVGTKPHKGGCRRNGMVFFPGNMPHQANKVIKGIKRCLKLEFFVLFHQEDSPKIRVSSLGLYWSSFWDNDQLHLVDNYLLSHQNFTGKQKNITVSPEMARTIHNVRLAIAEGWSGNPKLEAEMEMLFPGKSLTTLHDIFLATHWAKHSPMSLERGMGKAFIGTDAAAWDFMNQWKDFPQDCRLMIGLWSCRSDEGDYYHLSESMDRNGVFHFGAEDSFFSPPSRQNPEEELEENKDKYGDYDLLSAKIIHHFISTTDLEAGPPVVIQSKKGIEIPFVKKSDHKLLKNSIPSDQIQKPEKRKGMVTHEENEMCNDEDSGGHYESYQEYISYRIQVRWCLVRNKKNES